MIFIENLIPYILGYATCIQMIADWDLLLIMISLHSIIGSEHVLYIIKWQSNCLFWKLYSRYYLLIGSPMNSHLMLNLFYIPENGPKGSDSMFYSFLWNRGGGIFWKHCSTWWISPFITESYIQWVVSWLGEFLWSLSHIFSESLADLVNFSGHWVICSVSL